MWSVSNVLDSRREGSTHRRPRVEQQLERCWLQANIRRERDWWWVQFFWSDLKTWIRLTDTKDVDIENLQSEKVWLDVMLVPKRSLHERSNQLAHFAKVFFCVFQCIPHDWDTSIGDDWSRWSRKRRWMRMKIKKSLGQAETNGRWYMTYDQWRGPSRSWWSWRQPWLCLAARRRIGKLSPWRCIFWQFLWLDHRHP